MSCLLGAVIGVISFILLMVVPMAMTKTPPGQQDSVALAAGATLVLGTPMAALIGGLVGWLTYEYGKF